MFMLYSVDKQLSLLSHGARHGMFHRPTVSGSFIERKPLSLPPFSGWKGFHFPKYRPVRWERLKANVAYDVADAVEVINDLGLDTLTFLAVTVVIVPTFKSIKASPVRRFWCLTFLIYFL